MSKKQRGLRQINKNFNLDVVFIQKNIESVIYLIVTYINNFQNILHINLNGII